MKEARWLLLLHQTPKQPDDVRVKVWRRLQRIGAVSIKNAVHALPRSEAQNEDLQWVMRQIVSAGGEATLVEASFIQGLRADEVEALLNEARDADYEEVAEEIRATGKLFPKPGKLDDDARRKAASEIERHQRRIEEIAAIIDPDAKLEWGAAKGCQPSDGELRFDMFEAEFTHVGNLCSFEVLMQRRGQKDRALQAIADIVHDIDIKRGG